MATSPVITVHAVAGAEDHAIALNIAAELAAPDTLETLSVTLSGVPDGAVLSAGTDNHDGSWTLAAADLPGLTLTPAANMSGHISLAVTAVASLNGTQATTSAGLDVSVTPVADAPLLTVQAASGAESQPIALDINANLVAPDALETLSVTLSGVPNGATLSAGTDNHDGSWTLGASDLAGLTLTPPPNVSGQMTFTVTATSAVGGTQASVSAPLSVTIEADAAAPVLTVRATTGLEDASVPVLISATAAVDDVVSITIAGVPSGAMLSAGTNNHDGSWTLGAGDLAGLLLTPPANFHGDIGLNVMVTGTDSHGIALTTAAPLTVTVAAVADTPSLSVTPTLGAAGSPISLAITAATASGDPLSISIGGVPADAALSAGIRQPDGSWTLSPADLSNLTLKTGVTTRGPLDLTVTATTSEANGSTAQAVVHLPVTVSALAATPALTASAGIGTEDHPVSLAILATVSDPAETLSVVVAGVPGGATLSAGIHNSDGTWTLTPAQLPGLTLVPAAGFSGTIPLVVTAVGREGASQAQAAVNLGVTIAAVADAPSLLVAPAVGFENHAVNLSIASSLVVPAPDETLSVTISGVPAGATLSQGIHNSDGTWTLTSAQLATLQLNPPTSFSGTLQLTVTAESSVAGTHAVTSAQLAVTIASTAATPLLSALPVGGVENGAIALDVRAALPAGTLDETLAVSVSGVPAGAHLSAGTYMGNGTYSLTASQLDDLRLTPPTNFNGSISLTVKATAFDIGGASSSATLSVPVTVAAVTQAPVLHVSALAGFEDTALPLNIGLSLPVLDLSDTLGSVTITNVPAGAILSAGISNHDGSWTLTRAQLAGLSLTPPPNSNASFTLGISATSIGPDRSAVTATGTIPVTLTGVADTPTVTALNVSNTVAGMPVSLAVSGSLTDTDGSETLSFLIRGVPDGFTLNHGTNNGNNSWTLSAADLTGLALNAPPSFNGTLNLYATAVSHEQGGGTQSATASFAVGIGNAASGTSVDLGVRADVNALGVVKTSAGANVDLFPTSGAFGSPTIYAKEDTAITLKASSGLISTLLGSVTGGVIITSFLIGGIPAGSVLTNSAGVALSLTTGQGGTASITIPYATLNSGVTLTPPPNSDADFTLTSTANVLKLSGATVASVMGSTLVHVAGVADLPSLTVGAVTSAEGSVIPLSIGGNLADTDGSESLSFRVTGLPAGFALSAGTDNGNGTWSLKPSDLLGLSVTPPAGFSGAATLTIAAVSTERQGDQAVSQTTLTLNVTPVASGALIGTAPISSVSNAASIPLNLSVALKDADGSEAVTQVVIGNLPAGATLTGATRNPDGTWTVVDPTHPETVTLVPAAHLSGDFNLSITATTKEGVSGPSATTTAILPLHIGAALEAPTLSLGAAVGLGGTAIPLTLASHLLDAAAAQDLTIRLDGVPAGSVLSAGIHAADGSWLLTAAQLAGLTVTPPAGQTTDFTLNVTAIAHDKLTGLDAQVTGSIPVTVVEPPSLSVQAAVGLAGGTVGLHLSAALAELSPTESLSVSISGVPAGATLSSGTHNPDGSWTLTASQLAGLTLTAAPGTSGDFPLTVTAHTHESVSGLDAVATATLPVSLHGSLLAPSLAVAAAYGLEDSRISLGITSTIANQVPNENLTVTVSGVPTGATLSAGLHNPDGSWTLTGAQLAGLTVTPASHYTGDFTLSVTATAQDPLSGQVATTAMATLPVSVLGSLEAPVLHSATVVGFENTALDLGLSATLAHPLPTESVTVTLNGLPAGTTLDVGTHNADGSWTLDASQLAGLHVAPPHDYTGSFSVGVLATAHDSLTGLSAVSSATLPVTILEPVAAPHLDVTSSVVQNDGAIPLSIHAALGDHNPSESLLLNISGLPDGTSLSAGTHNSDNSWTLTEADTAGLTVTQPSTHQDFTLLVSATAHQALTGTESHVTSNLAVSFANHPVLTSTGVSGDSAMVTGGGAGAATTDVHSSADFNVALTHLTSNDVVHTVH